MNKQIKILFLCLSLILNACITQARYTSTVSQNIGTYQSLQTYFVQRLTSLGWRIFTRQTVIGHIVAANNETATSRDVVLVDLTSNRTNNVSLWIRTEVRNSRGDDWTKPSTVCENYNWAREQQLLNQILNR